MTKRHYCARVSAKSRIFIFIFIFFPSDDFILSLSLPFSQVRGFVTLAEPYSGCADLSNAEFVAGRIALLQRGQCMFAEKARNIQKAGAIGGIVIGEAHGAF